VPQFEFSLAWQLLVHTTTEGAGNVWTWTAIDADSKMIFSWHAGDRTRHTGTSFMSDLRARLANKVQLTTDGHKAYLTAVDAIDFDLITR
jgi:IS1 family transposase